MTITLCLPQSYRIVNSTVFSSPSPGSPSLPCIFPPPSPICNKTCLVAWAVGYFYLKNKDEYFKLCAMLFTGMTVFLVISTIYPNGHYLRPAYFEHNNIFIQMVKWLYATDTPTNLFPSVHVFNSIAVNIAVWHSDNFKKNKAVRYGSAVLMVLIILSTMFLKQHSVFDVVTGMVLAVFMYSVVYTTNWAAVTVAKPVRKPGQI